MTTSVHSAIPTFLTAEQVAEQLQVSPRSIREWAADGLIAYTRLGGSERSPMRFTQAAVDAYLASRTTPAKRPVRKGRR